MLPFPNKLQGELAFVLAAAVFQEAPCTPIIRGAQLKQAESTVDQLCDHPLEGIPTHRDHTIIVFVLTWNPQTQIKMGLPPASAKTDPASDPSALRSDASDVFSASPASCAS